jgi:hypothetical protein
MISCNDSGSLDRPPAEIVEIAAASLEIVCGPFVGQEMTEAKKLFLGRLIADQVNRDFGVVLSAEELDDVVKQFVESFGA